MHAPEGGSHSARVPPLVPTLAPVDRRILRATSFALVRGAARIIILLADGSLDHLALPQSVVWLRRPPILKERVRGSASCKLNSSQFHGSGTGNGGGIVDGFGGSSAAGAAVPSTFSVAVRSACGSCSEGTFRVDVAISRAVDLSAGRAVLVTSSAAGSSCLSGGS